LAAIVIDDESRGGRALVDSIANCGGGGLSGASPGLAMSAASCRGLVYRVPPGPRADRGGEMLNCSTCVYLPLFFLAALSLLTFNTRSQLEALSLLGQIGLPPIFHDFYVCRIG